MAVAQGIWTPDPCATQWAFFWPSPVLTFAGRVNGFRFDMYDLDSSGAIDAYEFGLMVKDM